MVLYYKFQPNYKEKLRERIVAYRHDYENDRDKTLAKLVRVISEINLDNPSFSDINCLTYFFMYIGNVEAGCDVINFSELRKNETGYRRKRQDFPL